MHIFILKTNYNVTDKYCVIIGNSVFYMSEYAHRANEVNMYSGRVTTPKQLHALIENAVVLKHIPTNLKLAIKERCKQIRHYQNDKHNTKLWREESNRWRKVALDARRKK